MCYGDVIMYSAVVTLLLCTVRRAVTLSILRGGAGVIFTLMGPVNTSDNGADAMTLSRCLDS